MKKLIFATVLAAIMLTGCDNGQRGTTTKGGIYPKITQYGADTQNYKYFYVLDERTGTVYLMFSGFRCAGITDAVNADGSPVTKEQLEAWRDDE